MQARSVRASRLLTHHLMQSPDDGSPRRSPQRHPQTKGVDRHSVGGRSRVQVMQNARGERRKCVVASVAPKCLNPTPVGSRQRFQSSL